MTLMNMKELKGLMGLPLLNDTRHCDFTYRWQFRSMKADEFGADIYEEWTHYQKRLEENPDTHRRHLNVHGILSYYTVALVIGYYTDENGETENIAAALYGHSRATSKQITAFLKSEGWQEYEIDELRKC